MKKVSALLVIGVIIALSLSFFSPTATSTVGVGCSPTKYDVQVTHETKELLPPLTVTGGGDETTHVEITLLGLGQNINGTAVFNNDEAIVKELESYIQVTPREMDIEPQQKKQVAVNVNIPPGKTGGIYAGISVKAFPKNESEDLAKISSAAEVICLVEMAIAGGTIDGYTEGMIIEEIPRDKAFTKEERRRIDEGEELPYRIDLAPVVVNTGTVHYKPHGYVIVKTEAMEEIGRPGLTEENVFPDYKRAINCYWQPGAPLPDGKYLAESHVWIGEKEDVYQEWFTVEGHGLARRGGKVLGVNPHVVEPDKPFTLEVEAKNTGSIPFKPSFDVTISDRITGKVYIKPEDFEVSSSVINTGQESKVSVKTSKTLELAEKPYKAEIIMSYKGKKYNYQDEELDEYAGELVVRKPPSIWRTIGNWLRYNWWMIAVPIAVLLVVLAIFLIIRHYRRRLTELEEKSDAGDDDEEDAETGAEEEEKPQSPKKTDGKDAGPSRKSGKSKPDEQTPKAWK